MNTFNPDMIRQLQAELQHLDLEEVEVNGLKLRPSQCFRFEASPTHILFNTNCPDTLRQRVNAIIAKYMPDEDSASK